MREKTGENVKCDVCGETLYRQKHQLNKTGNYFCSRECHYESKRDVDLGGYVQVECNHCKEFFGKRRYLLGKSAENFCSANCYSRYRAETGNTPFTGPTKPERYFKALLEQDGIAFTAYKLIDHPEFGRCYYDFYLPALETVVEVDGDYWHGNPKKYKKLNNQQKQIKKRDYEKELVLKENNLKLIRVWESDLYTYSTLKEII